MAADWLTKKGWKILDRNWRTALGELDIVAWDGSEVVIVEVRTTRTARFGLGFQSIDARKQKQVRRLANQYIQQKQIHHYPIRLDVISIQWKDREIDHIEGAF